MTAKLKRKAPAAGSGINPKLTALAAKIDKASALAEECGTYKAIFKLEDSLAATPAGNLEEMKLKARYVDADCIADMDKQIGPLPASIICDLFALSGKQTGSASKEAKRSHHARHS